jgi:hypothetical protein
MPGKSKPAYILRLCPGLREPVRTRLLANCFFESFLAGMALLPMGSGHVQVS